MIELKNISYSYTANSNENTTAVQNIDIKIEQGEFIGIAGHTGSGKTTIAQIISGLILPTNGTVIINGREIDSYKQAARELRENVGIVFQYPEHQLFEETVYRDIAFGPKNKRLSTKEVDNLVKSSAQLANLKEELFEKSPFELSGGQKRRVAIAGVLAMNPKVLILDEPAAGLDPIGREKLLTELHKIRKERKTTIILISHSMEDLAQNADRIILLKNGNKIKDDVVTEIFSDTNVLEECGLELPEITKIIKKLKENGLSLPEDIFTVEEATKAILTELGVLM